ncbi:uncharacterized protein LOC132739906 [Ruditapes philippinarum]|uniref:uncharacterized protein LOC132739906 n=1 Tax=Ruditapes philippinarum TaxID=129788 RepID=UPI00295AF628|nr:uncharacterized protein LOC132739906 [Ruditapes philippinarum]
MLDFELAAWNAVKKMFDQDVHIKGYVFHWCQEVWRQLQANGLSTTYNARKNNHKFLCQLMALLFLLVNHIVPTFRDLQGRSTNPQIVAFCSYLERQWIGNPSFQESLWCVFPQPVRTNNDVEGWHQRINRKDVPCPSTG